MTFDLTSKKMSPDGFLCNLYMTVRTIALDGVDYFMLPLIKDKAILKNHFDVSSGFSVILSR
jgi:hypothetical protein